ncbi:MAG: hypothetical protein DWH79_05760 [Planctomycetota bacterium]|nr:MAG: hypothetical protein DWH79_05760 [Planctomycetota bacterium]
MPSFLDTWPRRAGIAAAVAVGFLATAVIVVRYQPPVVRGPLSLTTGASQPSPDQASSRMLTKASAFLAALNRPGDWGTAVTDEEVNAWLTVDLPRNHARLLPRGMRLPVVRFLERGIAAAIRVGTGPFEATLWAEATVQLRRDNLIGVGIRAAGIGAIPISPGLVLKGIASRAAAAGVTTEIRLVEGQPQLLLQLPGNTRGAPGDGPEYHLEGLRLTPGELVLAGTTQIAPASATLLQAPDPPRGANPQR